jgi:hypothetical protein
MHNVDILAQTILPVALHGINPRTIMGDVAWNVIKKRAQQKANRHCMACGRFVAHKPGDWLECHEVYDFDLEKKEATIKNYVLHL